MSTGRLEVTATEGEGHTLIVLRGELDLASAPGLAAHLDGCTQQRVVVDCSELGFVDSSGLAVLLRAAAAHDVVLWHPSELVVRVLEVTGIEGRFEVER